MKFFGEEMVTDSRLQTHSSYLSFSLSDHLFPPDVSEKQLRPNGGKKNDDPKDENPRYNLSHAWIPKTKKKTWDPRRGKGEVDVILCFPLLEMSSLENRGRTTSTSISWFFSKE